MTFQPYNPEQIGEKEPVSVAEAIVNLNNYGTPTRPVYEDPEPEHKHAAVRVLQK